MPTMTEEYISKAEAERLPRVTRRLITLWIQNGVIREYQPAGGGRKMLKREEVERASRIVPAPPTDGSAE